MKTVNLAEDSPLTEWAKQFVFAGSYSKGDWDQDQQEDFDKFNLYISSLPEHKRIACVFVMHGKEAAQLEHAASVFKTDLVLTF